MLNTETKRPVRVRNGALCIAGLPAQGVNKVARCTSAYLLKAFDEVAHILKAAFVSCRIDGLAHHQQFAGAVYAYALDVLDVVQPSLLLEPFAEIVLAKAHHCGGGIQGDAAGVVSQYCA